jgi:hypothetical protein
VAEPVNAHVVELHMHPRCAVSCKYYRVGFTETDGTIATKHPPACEHPTRTGGPLYVKNGEEREDCPLRTRTA